MAREHENRGKKIPTNLTSSNHEIKILKSPKNACFFPKTIRKILLRPRIFCELVLVSRSARIASTTPLGVALSYFRENVCTIGGGEEWIRLGENLMFSRSETWICRTSRTIGFLTGDYTAPHPRWWTNTPGNGSEQFLVLLWELRGPNEWANWAHRGFRTKKMNFEIRFLKKTCNFWWLQNLNFMIWAGQVGRKNF